MIHHIAFAGFRHSHIFALWEAAQTHQDCRIAAAWENDPDTCALLGKEGKISLTHENFTDLLAPETATIIAIGDVYARRGKLAIAALQAGRHIISDKPICTDLAELDEIEKLSREKGLSVGCQLDLIENAAFRHLRSIIRAGQLGQVCTITISAQHPLRWGSRAAWYFEPGAHGGTINDIGVHVFHLVPWLTGLPWKEILGAREWNAKAAQAPHFMDCAQFYGVLNNGSSCFADVSYLAPDQSGFQLPQYWRVTVHGTGGMAEASYNEASVLVATDIDPAPRRDSVLARAPRGYLQDFLDEVEGTPAVNGLTTAQVLTASRLALETQERAARSH